MKVLITGGGGFLGTRLARVLDARGTLCGAPIAGITLLDARIRLQGPRFRVVEGDVADPAVLDRAVEPDTGAVFHLAAVVSGAAEEHFDLGMRVNVDGTRRLLDQLRGCRQVPRLVFASSVAAFGGELPPVVDEATAPRPQSSYGTQKVIGEALVSEYSRKGYVDGRSLRLPTVVVRPGAANAAASSFASAVIREPLNGLGYACPVGLHTGLWLASPRRVIDGLLRACELPARDWGTNRVLNLPGITATVQEMLEALARVAGPQARARVTCAPDPRIEAIVRTWPARFRTERALAMGFEGDRDIEAVIRDYVADERIRL